ncbi:MAG: toll/interleukin-1 receptor domain-containing protein [Coprobacillus cateniformis]|nr:toll/interleukin-1 receptor domain-containing protein [Coprobacillus cateniformis]
MDAFKQLSLEFSGIKNTIEGYDNESSAYNILSSLEESICNRDKDAIQYCLDVIIEWYKNNIQYILSNDYCYCKDEHDRNFKLIKEIREQIDNCDINCDDESSNLSSKSPLIFLSHSSSDKLYGDALEKFLIGLGVENNQLIYTSHPLHKIPLDENIYNYLRKNISREIFMIILWSNKYLDSPACLNEMGAAWVVQCDYTNIYVPNFSFGNPKYHQCAVDTRKMGAVLNGDEHCKQNMLELKNKIQKLFKLDNDESQTLFLIDSFIEEIKKLYQESNR